MPKPKKQRKRCDEIFDCCDECCWLAKLYDPPYGVRRYECTRLLREVTDPQAFLPDCPLEDV
jgi:hypothetical protein